MVEQRDKDNKRKEENHETRNEKDMKQYVEKKI